LAESATKWIDERKDLRPRTADDYRDIIRVRFITGLSDKHLGKLTPADVRAWNSKLSAGRLGWPAAFRAAGSAPARH
jgi:hypothetical protein